MVDHIFKWLIQVTLNLEFKKKKLLGVLTHLDMFRFLKNTNKTSYSLSYQFKVVLTSNC